ncbi:MAG: hypothetical protein HZB21_00790 [Deltaproteobacteria bacterium]|nr:hypothetical protein [Deltaproteobacteria bacterium]
MKYQAKDLHPTETKLYKLYLHELWWLSDAIKKKCEKLFSETTSPPPSSVYLIQVNPDLHSLIASILSDAANIKKLIKNQGGKLLGETGTKARLRKERAAMLDSLLSGIELEEILNHKIRNTLEHFDEYLDEANIELSKAAIPPSPMAAYNMIFSSWEVIKPRVYPIRLYISEERKFYNMKWSIDIGKIYKEAKAILSVLNKVPIIASTDGPGGLMLRLDTK